MVVVAMHDLAKRAEALARALGVWRDFGDGLAGSLTVSIVDGSHAVFYAVDGCRQLRDVDAPTLAIILLGHARGLRVDIGECPACRGAGIPAKPKWLGCHHATAWRVLVNPEGREMVDTFLSPGWVAFGDKDTQRAASALHKAGYASRRRFSPERKYFYRLAECECAKGTVGRHTLAWERAILDAMPRDQTGLTPAVRASSSARYLASFDGDPTTRTALTFLAHRLADPMHVAVFGDWMIEQRDPAKFPAPRDGLAALLHAWLRPCETCSGTGRYEHRNHWAGCWSCRGHGTDLGSLVPALSQALDDATAEASATVARHA